MKGIREESMKMRDAKHKESTSERNPSGEEFGETLNFAMNMINHESTKGNLNYSTQGRLKRALAPKPYQLHQRTMVKLPSASSSIY